MVGRSREAGSNAFAFGCELSANQRGLVIGNPHFPWQGSRRFYAMHQTIPGELDVVGGTLVSRATVALGAKRHVAWTHTVSTAQRFSLYQLELNGDFKTYRFDDPSFLKVAGDPPESCEEQEDGSYTCSLIERQVEVDVLQPECLDEGPDRDPKRCLESQSRKFYQPAFGDLSFLFQSKELPWTKHVAFAVRFVDEGLLRGLQGGIRTLYRAESVEDLKQLRDEYLYMPFNLIAADASGDVFYAEGGPVVHVTDAQFVDCSVGNGILDGFRAACQWGADETWSDHPRCQDGEGNEGPDDQALPPCLLPHLSRPDYVSNQNDSYWLSNLEEPLTGFPRVVGTSSDAPPGRMGEHTERTVRTRSALRKIRELQRERKGLDAGDLWEMILENRHFVGEILRDDLVTLCERNPVVKLSLPGKLTVTAEAWTAEAIVQKDVDLEKACKVLRDWDLLSNLDSRGAHLFREFLREANARLWVPESLRPRIAYVSSQPIDTPLGLDTANNPEALQALARAVRRLEGDRIPLDAALRDVQAVTRLGERIPIHGGAGWEGVLNKMEMSYRDGVYPEVDGNSTSWVFVAGFGDGDAIPHIRGLLAFSLSTDPTSPHFADQTRLFSQKQPIEIPFLYDQVVKETIGKALTLEE